MPALRQAAVSSVSQPPRPKTQERFNVAMQSNSDATKTTVRHLGKFYKGFPLPSSDKYFNLKTVGQALLGNRLFSEVPLPPLLLTFLSNGQTTAA